MDNEPVEVDHRGPIDYETPIDETVYGVGYYSRNVAIGAIPCGVLMFFIGTSGRDNLVVILIGCGLAAVGIICALLGQILHRLENMPDGR